MSYNRRMKTLAALAFALALTTAARAVDDSGLKSEEWTVLGWNDACSVAFEVKDFPKLGHGLQDDPAETRIGTLTIDPGKETSKLSWNLELDGPYSWDQRMAAASEKDLRENGYDRPGYLETVRVEVGNQPGLADVLQSTVTLSARLKTGWPGHEWRLSGADFNPLSTCVLLAYDRRSGGPRRRYHLVRVYASRARLERARAHTENALLLYQAGNLEVAAAEAANAAQLAPELPISRYHNAALLTLVGHIDEAMVELAAAVKLDPALRAKAREDEDFESLRVRDDYQDLVREP
jgi:tetratricopeptide (TPR) repeat protein